MSHLPILLLALACGRPDRARELAACQLISQSGDQLAECLVMKYSWGPDSAGPAKMSWQAHLDSARREREQVRMTKQAVMNECTDRVGSTGLPELGPDGQPNRAYFGALRSCFKDRFGLSDSVATDIAAEWMLWQLALEYIKLGGSSKSADSLLRVWRTESVVVRRQ